MEKYDSIIISLTSAEYEKVKEHFKEYSSLLFLPYTGNTIFVQLGGHKRKVTSSPLNAYAFKRPRSLDLTEVYLNNKVACLRHLIMRKMSISENVLVKIKGEERIFERGLLTSIFPEKAEITSVYHPRLKKVVQTSELYVLDYDEVVEFHKPLKKEDNRLRDLASHIYLGSADPFGIDISPNPLYPYSRLMARGLDRINLGLFDLAKPAPTIRDLFSDTFLRSKLNHIKFTSSFGVMVNYKQFNEIHALLKSKGYSFVPAVFKDESELRYLQVIRGAAQIFAKRQNDGAYFMDSYDLNLIKCLASQAEEFVIGQLVKVGWHQDIRQVYEVWTSHIRHVKFSPDDEYPSSFMSNSKSIISRLSDSSILALFGKKKVNPPVFDKKAIYFDMEKGGIVNVFDPKNGDLVKVKETLYRYNGRTKKWRKYNSPNGNAFADEMSAHIQGKSALREMLKNMLLSYSRPAHFVHDEFVIQNTGNSNLDNPVDGQEELIDGKYYRYNAQTNRWKNFIKDMRTGGSVPESFPASQSVRFRFDVDSDIFKKSAEETTKLKEQLKNRLTEKPFAGCKTVKSRRILDVERVLELMKHAAHCINNETLIKWDIYEELDDLLIKYSEEEKF